MKRTKSMYYYPTEESYELYLYIVNTGEIYKEFIRPLIELLRKRCQQGVYDEQKAIDAYFAIATTAAKMYNREFASEGVVNFSVRDRFTVAIEMEKRYLENVMSND